MYIYWQIFLAFFIPSIVGYGGGPAFIPLIQNEVVNRYGWLTLEEFIQVLAVGNALPGVITTKIAGYVGFKMGGILGAAVALFASIGPSLILLIFMLGLLYKYKDSPRVKKMTSLIRPTIAVLLGWTAYQFFASSWGSVGIMQTVLLTGVSILLLEKLKIHPAYVILLSLTYGGIFLS